MTKDTDSLLSRKAYLIAAACLASHATANLNGFRQRDVKFLLELFINWTLVHEYSIKLNNNQIARFLSSLVNDGMARNINRNNLKLYRLTRIGIINLLEKISVIDSYIDPEQFFFSHYFIKNYKSRILEIIEKEGKQFPIALKIEVENLLDINAYKNKNINLLKKELIKLKAREEDSINTAILFEKMSNSGKNIEEIYKTIEERFPYELNSLKPLSELLSNLPQELSIWEMQFGSNLRANEIFKQKRELLTKYLECTYKLQDE